MNDSTSSSSPSQSEEKSTSTAHSKKLIPRVSKHVQNSQDDSGTETSSSRASKQDKKEFLASHALKQFRESSNKKDLSSGSGRPITQSGSEDQMESKREPKYTTSTKVSSNEEKVENPFGAYTPDPKKMSKKKYKSHSAATSKPTAIFDPMHIDPPSTVAVREANVQRQLLRLSGHPEFSTNVFGSDPDETASEKSSKKSAVKVKKEKGAHVDAEESKNVTREAEGSKKRKRDRLEKHNNEDDKKAVKKSKKDKKISMKQEVEREKAPAARHEKKDKRSEKEKTEVPSKPARKSVMVQVPARSESRSDTSSSDESSSSGSNSSSSSSDRSTTKQAKATHNVEEQDRNKAKESEKKSKNKKKHESKDKSSHPPDHHAESSTSSSKKDDPSSMKKEKSSHSAIPLPTPFTSTSSLSITASNDTLTKAQLQILKSMKSLLPETTLQSTLEQLQTKAKKSHAAKAQRPQPPSSTDDTMVILTAARDTLTLLAGTHPPMSRINANDPQISARNSSIDVGGVGGMNNNFGNARGSSLMESELVRIVADKQKEVERLEQENRLFRELLVRKS